MKLFHSTRSEKESFKGERTMDKMHKLLAALVLGIALGCSGCDVYISGFPLYEDVDCDHDDCDDDYDTIIVEEDHCYDDYYYYEYDDWYYYDDCYYGYYKVNAGK
jgi:hypothetical protein